MSMTLWVLYGHAPYEGGGPIAFYRSKPSRAALRLALKDEDRVRDEDDVGCLLRADSDFNPTPAVLFHSYTLYGAYQEYHLVNCTYDDPRPKEKSR